MKSLLLLGGGGHFKSVVDSILELGIFNKLGLVLNDDSAVAYQSVLVVGCDDDLVQLYRSGWDSAFITVGSVGNTSIREKLYRKLCDIGFDIPSIIDPSAIIADNLKIGRGCYIGKRSVLNSNSEIQDCAIINTGAIVEHDCAIGMFAHIATGAVLCGNVKVGDCTHIGAGSVVKQGVCIGNHTLVGMGSVVTHDLGDNVTAYGNPCREIQK